MLFLKAINATLSTAYVMIFDLPGIPIRLFVRAGHNPYANEKFKN